MANFQMMMTPAEVNAGTEGSMDEWIVGGASIQRSAYLDVYVGTNRKIVEAADGGTFTNTIASWSDNPILVNISED